MFSFLSFVYRVYLNVSFYFVVCVLYFLNVCFLFFKATPPRGFFFAFFSIRGGFLTWGEGEG